MDPRYANPTVTDVHTLLWTYQTWCDLEATVAAAQVELGLIDAAEGAELVRWLTKVKIGERQVREIQAIEVRVRHDFVAFLTWLRADPWAPRAARWLHFGLTSSDIIDTTMGYRFRVLHRVLSEALGDLVTVVAEMAGNHDPVVGRTHGQVAEPTSIGHRAAGWMSLLRPVLNSLLHHTAAMQVTKMSGPVGTFTHNPPGLEDAVAVMTDLQAAGWGATQIVPRSTLAMWASAASQFAACCSKIAMDTRLMNIVGECMEGQPDGAIGSSSMAHKRNPIVAEQIAGMNRMAQGYAAMLQPLDLWLERDISHSSVERVAIPDLWHVLLHTIKQTTWLLTRLRFVDGQIEVSFESNAPWTSEKQNEAIRDGMGYEEARAFALSFDTESYAPREDARRFTAAYRAAIKRAGADVGE